MDKSDIILDKLGKLKCDFSSLELGDLSDIKKLYSCKKCGNDVTSMFTFKWSINVPNIIKVCNECKYEEEL